MMALEACGELSCRGEARACTGQYSHVALLSRGGGRGQRSSHWAWHVAVGCCGVREGKREHRVLWSDNDHTRATLRACHARARYGIHRRRFHAPPGGYMPAIDTESRWDYSGSKRE